MLTGNPTGGAMGHSCATPTHRLLTALCYAPLIVISAPHSPILRIAVPAPLRRLFDYLPPAAGGPESLKPGARVRVPFGKRQLVGILTEVSIEGSWDQGELKTAVSVLDEVPLLPATLMDLCAWAADYYQHPIGDVFSAALPRGLRDGRELPRHSWRLSTRGLGLPEGALARARSQREAVALLQAKPRSAAELADAGISRAVLRELEKKALIERCEAPGGFGSEILRCTGPELLADQEKTIDAVQDGHFSCHLLQGITGSGKTEVYLRLIERCLHKGGQALVLIPEIGLTPQTLARFQERFAVPIAILHSGLTDGQRLEAWAAARSGAAGIIIGTRSAVFTPLARPGLIIVDEEHDGSYKQQDGFRYSARDVAVKRAQLEGCPVLLGSATPSLESLANSRRGRYQIHYLRQRPGAGQLPGLETLDLRGATLEAGISEALMAAIRETVQIHKHQVLLFLNRRGYAPTLQCHQCAWIAACDNCDARMTVHLRHRRLRCHHCAAQKPLPPQCPSCGSAALLTRGLGTEQTEDYLRRELPCPVHRVDSDSMRGREAMASLLEIAREAEPCVILGTQMLTKGHHFPGVQLVGVIDADALLFSADFRGEERMAQLVTQVAGRAGREQAGGRVLIQTHYPDDELFASLQQSDYGVLGAAMLQRRQATGLPPFGQLAMLRADAREERQGEAFLQGVNARLRGQLPRECQLIGPLPSSMPRRAGRFRWQLWCLSPSRGAARRANGLLVDAAEHQQRPSQLAWFLDVDPQDVM